ncbi:hypothetical protein, partial [Thermoactinomyces intermedius]|uniref:hypothetical protein n=1 Tax=Thermoactinomyces intermedius TaxID=2024 RepID=UPI001C694BE8
MYFSNPLPPTRLKRFHLLSILIFRKTWAASGHSASPSLPLCSYFMMKKKLHIKYYSIKNRVTLCAGHSFMKKESRFRSALFGHPLQNGFFRFGLIQAKSRMKPA